MRLQRFDEVLRELAALVAAPPKLVGPWTLAQAVAHCAQSIELSMTGYPTLRAWPVRAFVGPLVKRRFLSRGEMSHDIIAPIAGAPEIADLPLQEAAARLQRAIDAFRGHHGVLAPHLAYGSCSKDEYERLHSMHVADHLSAPA